MIDLDSLAGLAEPRLYVAMGIAVISGLVRGFSGFGSALIYIPLISALYEPRVAAGTVLLIDFVASTPFTLPGLARCNWREVLPVTLAAALAIPVGTLLLLLVDPVTMRWVIAAIVLTLLAVLASGWRYRGQPTLPVSLGVGAVAGLGSGAVQIAGPPVIVFWLGGAGNAAVVRANLMVFFMLMSVVAIVSYLTQGVFTADILALSVLLGPSYFVALALGAWAFRGSSETTYRRVAYAVVALAALVSLPVLDGLLR